MNRTWKIADREITSFPLVWAVINLTDDSFYPGSRTGPDPSAALEACEVALERGADVLDLGADSTRPGSEPVGADKEIRTLLPVINSLTEKLPYYSGDKPRLLSVDTWRPEVARKALGAGADIVNDISGMTFGNREDMLDVLSDHDCGYVLMHTAGRPKVMQDKAVYDDVVAEVENFFKTSLNRIGEAGIGTERVLLDPGIGFGKKLEHNLRLLKAPDRFHELGRPLLYGTSRKSWLKEVTGRPVESRLAGTVASNALLLEKGVENIRVHDVAEAVDTVRVVEAVTGESSA